MAIYTMGCIDHLLVAGCSFSYGSELFSEDDADNINSINLAYGKYLADKLNCKYTNIALPASSNLEISRRVQQYIDFEKYDKEKLLVIIGWTELNRFTFIPNMGFNLLNALMTKRRPLSFSSYTAGLYDLIKTESKKLTKQETFALMKGIQKLEKGTDFVLFFEKYIFNSSHYYDLNYIKEYKIHY
jgi:hypothetical protein